MTTTTARQGFASVIDQMRGIPATNEERERKVLTLNDLLAMAGDSSFGEALIEHVHGRIDEALALLAAAMAPWEGSADFATWEPSETICHHDEEDEF